MKYLIRLSEVLAAALFLGACAKSGAPEQHAVDAADSLIGAWRSQISFTSGAFSSVKDLEFMYVFNQGGTLTESSNYDAAPPVPPAYGVWRSTGPRQFETKYIFYITSPPKSFEEISGGTGWMPAGSGTFVEHITLSEDGKTYTSTIDYSPFDAQGKPAEGGGKATGSGSRIGF